MRFPTFGRRVGPVAVVLAVGIGGEHSMGAAIGTLTARVAEHVTTDVVPGANHWVLEENPAYVLTSVRNFLKS